MSLIHDKYAGGGPCMIVSDKLWLCNAVDHSVLLYFVLARLLCMRFKEIIKKLKNLKIMTNMQRGEDPA